MPFFVNDLKSEAAFSVNDKKTAINPELIDAENFVIPIKLKLGNYQKRIQS